MRVGKHIAGSKGEGYGRKAEIRGRQGGWMTPERSGVGQDMGKEVGGVGGLGRRV